MVHVSDIFLWIYSFFLASTFGYVVMRRHPNNTKLNSPLVDRSNVSTRSKLHLQPRTTRLSYLLNPFLLATALTNEISSFLYINQFGSISTSFWRYPLKSVRRKSLGWISYFTPSSSSVPPNVFATLIHGFKLMVKKWIAHRLFRTGDYVRELILLSKINIYQRFNLH